LNSGKEKERMKGHVINIDPKVGITDFDVKMSLKLIKKLQVIEL
jgi:hypothetical protein